MNKKLLNSIISFILIFSIATFSLIGCSKSGGSAKSAMEAFEKNIVDSYKASDEVFGFSKFYKTLENGTYTLAFNVPAFDSNIELAEKDNTAKISVKFLGSNLIEFFADQKDLILISDFFDGKMYGLNLEEMLTALAINIQNIEQYNEEINKLLIDFLVNSKNELYNIFGEVPTEKVTTTVTLNEKETKVDGVKFNVTTKEVFLISKYIIEEIEKNQDLKEFFAYSTYSGYMGLYPSVDEAKEIIEKAVSQFDGILESTKAEIETALEEEQLDIFTVEAYINDGYIVKSKLVSVDDPELFFEFESFGGSYPFENAMFTFSDNGTASIKTSGENTKDKYSFAIELIDNSTDIIIGVEYDKNTKDLIFSAKDLINTEDDYKFYTKLEKLDPGKELLISIPDILSEITFKDTAEIVKPSGEYTDLLTLTDEELDLLLENFSEQVMGKFFEFLMTSY